MTVTCDDSISVLMPTFEHGRFIPRAVRSLLRQTMTEWELVMIDDGSGDSTPDVIGEALQDARVRAVRLPCNAGLGAAVNAGLEMASGNYIAYLPSDDVFYPDHLAALRDALVHRDAIIAVTGIEHGGGSSLGPPPGWSLQAVQVMHRHTDDAWIERDEMESDDLEGLFFGRFLEGGPVGRTGRVTCRWTQHPQQRHRLMNATFDGGLNPFRRRYRIREPLRFRSRDGGLVDEPALYRRFRRPPASTREGLKILIVGELSYHPERIVALEERGHRLFGLWIDDPLGPSTVGPLPFGNVVDVPPDDWRDAVRRIRPDVVYALLNWRAVPLAHAVLEAKIGVPLVWHFKEAPMRCMRRGTFAQLVDLCTRSDAQIYSSSLEKEWFDASLPGNAGGRHSLVIDGDLPKADWFTDDRKPRLSDVDGQIHTVCIGRPMGLDTSMVRALADHDIHLHLYGIVRGPRDRHATGLAGELAAAAPAHVHLHEHVDQRRWVAEFSRYDAAWLHRFSGQNRGDVRRATWDDLNLPARIGTLMAAGVPLLQQRSPGARVAAQELIEDSGVGLLYEDMDDVVALLHEPGILGAVRERAWRSRLRFTFDHHVDRLLQTFREVTR